MRPLPTALLGPMAIEPFWLRVMFGIASRGRLDAEALSQARAEWQARSSRPRLEAPGAPVEGTGGTLRILGDIGIITIDGPLFRHANLFTDYSGGTTYDALWRGLETAETHRQISRILLHCNSPGGEADGCSELAAFIRSLSKLTWAYADGMCASAAFWLCSQVDTIIAEETAEVGSIGVRCGIIDYAAADEMAGVREIEIISSQSPGKRSQPVDDAVIGRLQTRIDDLADKFIEAVVVGRGVPEDTVLEDFGQGDVMIAGKALHAGMVDGLGNFHSTLKALALEPISSGL